MPAVHRSALIAAPRRTVAGVLRDPATTAAALDAAGHRFHGPGRPLVAGDVVEVVARLLPGLAVPVRARMATIDVDGLRTRLVRGPARRLTHRVTLADDTGRVPATLLREELSWTAPLGPLGRVADLALLRRLATTLLAARVDAVARRSRSLAAGTIVVATAIVGDGQVLAARRSRPAALAGRWELPGGRVEDGEDEDAAVIRECREELGTEVRPAGRIGTDVVIAGGLLRLHAATLAPGAAPPRALEHSELRWVGPAQLHRLEWLDPDLALLGDLTRLLVHDRERPGTTAGQAPSKGA